ncbi:MAG: hypothetical protein AVDCRST_MAG55-2770, partial [uncultured Rubrobacteraceae bacterium]
WQTWTTSSPATAPTVRPSDPARRPRSPEHSSATGGRCCPRSGSSSPRARSSRRPITWANTPGGSRRTYRR